MATYANVPYEVFKTECTELMQMAFIEGLAHRGGDLSLDDDFFNAIEAAGGLRIIVGYAEDDTPVCYSLTVVSSQPQDDSRLVATTDSAYVHPDHRKSLLGYELTRVTQADLASFCPGAVWRLVRVIDGIHENKSRRSLGKLGFKATHVILEKTLEA